MSSSRGQMEPAPEGRISPWWRYGVLVIFIVGFGVLIWVSATAYRVAPPIPERVIDPSGAVVFSGDDILSGQEVFLKHGLMDNGTLWGHGSYLGPDFSATYLHNLVTNAQEAMPGQNAEAVGSLLSENRYDAQTRELRYTAVETDSYQRQVPWWKNYFLSSETTRGLLPAAVSDPQEVRQLVAFFAWAAWASAAHRAGQGLFLHQQLPLRPGMRATGRRRDAILWSALSLIALLGGHRARCCSPSAGSTTWAGRSRRASTSIRHAVRRATPRQPAGDAQVLRGRGAPVPGCRSLVGGGTAHYRAEPGELLRLRPGVAPARATSCAPGTCSWPSSGSPPPTSAAACSWPRVAGRAEPKGQVDGINVLFGALVLVVAGSLLGELLGIRQLLGKLWFWFGHQGWEYLDLGRAWQVLLAVGPGALGCSCCSARVGPARRRPGAEGDRLALPAGGASRSRSSTCRPSSSAARTHFTVVDTWRFWIIHLWVEGFFELFATVMVAVIFFKLGMVTAADGDARDLPGRDPLPGQRHRRHGPPLVLDRPDRHLDGALRRCSRPWRSCR